MSTSSHSLDDWPFHSAVTRYHDSSSLSSEILSTVNDNVAERTHHFKFTAQSVDANLPPEAGFVPPERGNDAWVYFDLLPANVTFNITVEQDDGNNVFAVDGEIKKDLILVKGGTYTFNHQDNATHPLEFADYTVTQDGNNIVLTIPADSTTTNTTYYCSNQSGMGGNIQVIEPAKTTYAYIDDAVLTHRLFVPNEGYLYPIGSIEMKFDSAGAGTAYIMDIEFVDDGLLNFVPYWHIEASMQRSLSKAINNCIRDLPIQQQNFQTNVEIHAVPAGNTTITDSAGNVIDGNSITAVNLGLPWFMHLLLDDVDNAQRIFAHEYYHLYHLSLSPITPRWFVEGLADFFAEKYNREHLNKESAFLSSFGSFKNQIDQYLTNYDVDRFTVTLLAENPPNYNIRLYLILLLASIHNPNTKQDASYLVWQLSYNSRNKLAEYQWLHSRNVWDVILKDFWHGINSDDDFTNKFETIFGQTVSTFVEAANAHMYAYPAQYLFSVKVVNNEYVIDGTPRKELTLKRRNAYFFDLSDASNDAHTFVIKNNDELFLSTQKANNYIMYYFDQTVTGTLTYGSEQGAVLGADISLRVPEADPLYLEDKSIHPDLLTNLPLYPDSNLMGREGNTQLLFSSFENDSEITIQLSPNAQRFIFDIDEPVDTNVHFEISWGTNFENTITTASVNLNNKGTYTIPFPQRHALNTGHALWTSDSKIVLKNIVTYTVSNTDGEISIDGEAFKSLTLQRGSTYTFNAQTGIIFYKPGDQTPDNVYYDPDTIQYGDILVNPDDTIFTPNSATPDTLTYKDASSTDYGVGSISVVDAPNIRFMAIQNDVAPTHSSFTVSGNLIEPKSVHLQNNSKISFIGQILSPDASADITFTLSNSNDPNVVFTAKLSGNNKQVCHAYCSEPYTAALYNEWQIATGSETVVELSFVDVLSMDYATQIWHDSATDNGNEIEMTGDVETCTLLLPGNGQKVSFSHNAKISFQAKSLDSDSDKVLKFVCASTISWADDYYGFAHKLHNKFSTDSSSQQIFETTQLSDEYQSFVISDIFGLMGNFLGLVAQNVAVKDIVVHTRDDPGTADLKVQNASYIPSDKKLVFTVENVGTTKSIGRYYSSIQKAIEFYTVIPVSTERTVNENLYHGLTDRPFYANDHDQAYYHTRGITTWDRNTSPAVFTQTTPYYTTGFYTPYTYSEALDPLESIEVEWDLPQLQPGTYMLTLDFFVPMYSAMNSSSYTRELIDTYDISSNNNFLFTVPTSSTSTSTSTGQALGDPYVYPMRTPVPVKLPNRAASYCLYQSEKTFINAEVRCATAEHQARMLQFVKNLGRETKRVIADGYFFSKFFVNDGSRDAQLMIDLRERTMEAQGDHAFAISESTHPTGSQDWGGVARNVLIEWPVDQTVMKLTVSFYTNPHIENGISLSVESLPANAFGLLVHNYKPKLMRLRSLTTTDTQIIQRLRKAQKITHLKDIKSRAEIWRR